MSSIHSYKQKLNLENISLRYKGKRSDKWYIEVKYCDRPLVFQTPVLIKKENVLESEENIAFLEYITSLEELIVMKMHEESKNLFNGRVYSQNKIKGSMNNSWIISDAKMQFLLSEPSEDLPTRARFIFAVENIIFTKTDFKIEYTIENTKDKKKKPMVNYFEIDEPPKKENADNDNLDFFL